MIPTISPRNGARHVTIPVLGTPPHSFRKTVATLIDDEGLSARMGPDHLGHSGRIHTPVADLLDRAVRDGDDISD